jgi:hypothetical protein
MASRITQLRTNYLKAKMPRRWPKKLPSSGSVSASCDFEQNLEQAESAEVRQAVIWFRRKPSLKVMGVTDPMLVKAPPSFEVR